MGRRCDDSGPFATLQQTQILRLATQEARTIARWRVFGLSSVPGVRSQSPNARGMCSASVRNRATHGSFFDFECQVRHQLPDAQRKTLAERRAAK
jgi:hypothetical protein